METFTIKLLLETIIGDAIIAEPSTCDVSIETNDKANGVLSINFADSVILENGEKAFVIDEDTIVR